VPSSKQQSASSFIPLGTSSVLRSNSTMAGVVIVKNEKGERSSTALNKSVYSAMAAVLGDEALASAIKSERDWRHQYIKHLDRLSMLLIESQDPKLLEASLSAGLSAIRNMLEIETSSGCKAFDEAMAAPTSSFARYRVEGKGKAMETLTIPYNGKELAGKDLEAQCDLWAKQGVMEPDCANAIKAGAQKIGSLSGRTFVVLGAGAELGPTPLLLKAGATVAAVGTRKPGRWSALIKLARESAGTLLVPVPPNFTGGDDDAVAQAAGGDLITEAPAFAEWVLGIAREGSGPITLGTYIYMDSDPNVRVTAVADWIAERLASELPASRFSCAWLTSCSTDLVVPEEACAAAQEIFDTRCTWWQRTVGKRSCLEAIPSLDGARMAKLFVERQGPNYALAQLMRQWRAMTLCMNGFVVSAPVAPACRTESVIHNKTFAVVLEGVGHLPPLEAFDADTAKTAMFGLLVSDLTEPMPQFQKPQQLFTRNSFHSGLWRCPIDMASLGATLYMYGKLSGVKTPASHIATSSS
jgi:hypothetical protein